MAVMSFGPSIRLLPEMRVEPFEQLLLARHAGPPRDRELLHHIDDLAEVRVGGRGSVFRRVVGESGDFVRNPYRSEKCRDPSGSECLVLPSERWTTAFEMILHVLIPAENVKEVEERPRTPIGQVTTQTPL